VRERSGGPGRVVSCCSSLGLLLVAWFSLSSFVLAMLSVMAVLAVKG
jgi:uncharacterized protein YodC (DUF2158 family)